MEKIRSIGYGFLYKDHSFKSALNWRINLLIALSHSCVPVEIPEDDRCSMIMTRDMPSREIIPKLRTLINSTPKPMKPHPSIHKTYEKIFNISENEVYAFTSSQLLV
ncbi:unnamed protein product [Ambrosiozyma monospora]|uniref:Unnamed protein product n=1 Tax=Ambrosiozyma monospora TaxID=43982 RepID=A0ACB5TC32_AMBMO|nr:unnamed protein product [Ambrosiozyma monospora]